MGMVFLVLFVLSLFELLTPETVRADTFDNACSFYQTYGHEMKFLPGESNQGEIYYATKAKKDENTGIKYTTLGWKIRVFDSAGGLVETLYYKLGGNHMSSVDVRTEKGYEYCLYKVTLANIKQRMTSAGLAALENPGCNIIFDACTTTKLNGVVQGGMTDAGPSWGKVYTTYNGIVHAQNWSSTTKQTLKSYYNKTVAGLFYEVVLQAGEGIEAVDGAGRYCFGTQVKVTANVMDGYHFVNWTGGQESSQEEFSFSIGGKDIALTANATENVYEIMYSANGGEGSIHTQTLWYSQSFVLPEEGFFLEGSTLSGWKMADAEEENFMIGGQKVSVKTLVHDLGLQRENGAQIVLEAVWNQGPQILTEQIYVSRKDALAGMVTEEWLAQRAQAYDKEDGMIPYGKGENTSFGLEEFNPVRYTSAKEETILREQFFATDSAGNVTRKSVDVYIVDTAMYPAEKYTGRVRFISKKYFKDEEGNLIGEIMGGLAEDSVWRLDKAYRELLEQLFP